MFVRRHQELQDFQQCYLQIKVSSDDRRSVVKIWRKSFRSVHAQNGPFWWIKCNGLERDNPKTQNRSRTSQREFCHRPNGKKSRPELH
ncbi:unnamed protein product [Arctia plantaginis]|uniref:Uncharacterized protein n=1 Tax=Arctia plantaginis TaxID=874455 RepID=A0A8S0ZTC8_ARCPL|nr:unnamed protein product [Arctia plantaginis]